MHALRTLLIGLIIGTSTSLEAGPILIPSDLAVSFSAEPNAELHPGDVVAFTISITNNGPEPVDRFALGSSPIYDELDVLSATINCNSRLILAVTDLEDGFYYTYTWAVLLPGDPPLQVGETRYCYFPFRIHGGAGGVHSQLLVAPVQRSRSEQRLRKCRLATCDPGRRNNNRPGAVTDDAGKRSQC